MKDDNVIQLRPTPQQASDSLINSLWDLAKASLPAFNAEAMFIDLQRRYQFKTEQRPSLYRLPEWSAIDELTFDPDPSSKNHVIGTGVTEQDAKMDLLEQLNGL